MISVSGIVIETTKGNVIIAIEPLADITEDHVFRIDDNGLWGFSQATHAMVVSVELPEGSHAEVLEKVKSNFQVYLGEFNDKGALSEFKIELA